MLILPTSDCYDQVKTLLNGCSKNVFHCCAFANGSFFRLQQCFSTFLRTDYFRTSISLRGLKTDYDYKNDTNTSFDKFG